MPIVASEGRRSIDLVDSTQLKSHLTAWTAGKADAFRFLKALQQYLNGPLRVRETVIHEIRKAVAEAKQPTSEQAQKCQSFPEGAFLNIYIIRLINQFLTGECGLTDAEARKALLSESYRSHRGIASATPVWRGKYPFRKVLGVKNEELLRMWQSPAGGLLSMNCCPDLALRSQGQVPSVVFEAKYFRGGNASRALVDGIYECFFYRGLPSRPAPTKEHADWNYEYACFLAYDATTDGVLRNEWSRVDKEVKKAMWQGANIFVMVLPHD